MRAYEQVEATLKARLADGSLKAGTVLLEGPIATILGTSRTPVRQALDSLREQGLLSAFDGRGLVVGDGLSPVVRVDLAASLQRSGSDGVRKAWAWQKTHDAIERVLVRLAVLGRFRINEVALAEEVGIGRTVARDVLLRIQSSGVVEKTEKAHWVTVPLDDGRVRDLYGLRLILERAAIVEAAALLPEGMARDMLDRIAGVGRQYPKASAADLDSLETDLHITCIGHAANKEILNALPRTRCIIVSSKHLLGAGRQLPPDDPFLAEHEAVLSALAHRKAKAAGDAMVAHLTSACDKVTDRLRAFRTSEPDPDLAFAARMPRG